MLAHAFKFVENVVFYVGETEHPLAKGDGKDRRDQDWNGDAGVRKSSADSQREIPD